MTPEETYLKVKQLVKLQTLLQELIGRNRYIGRTQHLAGLLDEWSVWNDASRKDLGTASWTRSGGNGKDQREDVIHQSTKFTSNKTLLGKIPKN